MLGRVLVLVSLSSVAVAAGCAAPRPTPEHARASALPEVPLTTLDGTPTQLQAALGGRPALVSLWATWCDACAKEHEALRRLAERAPKEGAVLIAIDVGEPRAQVAAYVKQHGLDWPQLVDEEFRFADALGQKRVPATLVIDRSGQLTFVGGALDGEALAALRQALGTPLAAQR